MKRTHDKYGRGSAAANGIGFVDLEPGDTFDGLVFDGDRKLATITLKQNHGQHNFYSVEALEINEDAESERTPRGAISEDLNSAPLQNLASQLANKITYYVGDVKRTKPSFVASEEPFSVERAASEILKMKGDQTMAGTDISVIILIGQEKIHLKRCIERLAPLDPKCIWLIESQPDDGGVAIAKETAEKLGLTLKTVYNKWPGLHAKQLNWAIDNLPIETTWILRLDADEYLYSETCEEVKQLVTDGGLPPDVTSLSLSLARVFCGRKIRFGGTAHIPMVRFFKYGVGRCEDRAMDEHIITSEGRDYRLKGEFADHNLNSMDWWREKHRGYAKREAADALAFARGEIHFKPAKEAYYKMPRYLRALIYFGIRYFLKGGFLDGYAGWMWHFWQGLWYRWIVDREIGRARRG